MAPLGATIHKNVNEHQSTGSRYCQLGFFTVV